MPSLRSLSLPSSCAESVVDSEAAAVRAITTLTTLRLYDLRPTHQYLYDDDGRAVEEETGEWVLDLSGLTTLTALHLERCAGVADEEVLTLSHLEGL
jgi:hypothetical protein